MTAAGTVDVFWVDLARCDAVPIHLLDDVERAKLRTFRRAGDRQRSAMAAALLRLVVGTRLCRSPQSVPVIRVCRSCGSPHGKPVIDVAGAPHVSVSHGADHVAVAVTDVAETGVDVEATDAYLEPGTAELVVTAEDREGIRTSADLLRCWVRKESLVKATGDGLLVDLLGIRVTAPSAAPRVVSYAGRPGLRADLHDLRGAGRPGALVAALAVLHDGPVEVREHDATAGLVVASWSGVRRSA